MPSASLCGTKRRKPAFRRSSTSSLSLATAVVFLGSSDIVSLRRDLSADPGHRVAATVPRQQRVNRSDGAPPDAEYPEATECDFGFDGLESGPRESVLIALAVEPAVAARDHAP